MKSDRESIRKRRFEVLSWIALIAIVTAVCISLFPNQDLLFLLSIACATAVGLPVSTKKEIVAAIGDR